MRTALNRGGVLRLILSLRTLLWLGWAAVVAGGLFYCYFFGAPSFKDEFDYLEIAASISSGEGYSHNGVATAYRPPTWPIVLAAPLTLGFPVQLLSSVAFLILAASSLVAKKVADDLFGSGAGWIASYLMLLYPLNFFTATTLYPQALATLLTLAAIRILGCPGRSLVWCSLGGLVLGALVLAVPTMIVVAAIILVWGLWIQSTRPTSIFVVVASGAAPILAWSVRNAVEFGRLIPTSTATGVNLLLGNSDNATAASGVNANIDKYRAVAVGMDEVDANSYFTREAIRWVLDNGPDALLLYCAKVAHYFVPVNAPQSGSLTLSAILVGYGSFGAIASLALTRLVLYRVVKLRAVEHLMLALFVLNAFFMAVAFTRARFRQPLDSLLILEAAVCIAVLVSLVMKRRRAEKAKHAGISGRGLGAGGPDWPDGESSSR